MIRIPNLSKMGGERLERFAMGLQLPGEAIVSTITFPK